MTTRTLANTVFTPALLVLNTACLSLSLQSPAWASAAAAAPVAPTAPAPGATPATAPLAQAEVRRVEPATGRLQLRHGPIPNLDMPPMTMVFRVRSPDLLVGLREGDQILFSAEKIDGAYVVTHIEKRP
ncbi:MAG: copper-binding protein [Betaproteobacteria bacterium]|nr:copper-binding protein [Betaproteobacteria bacterium]